MDPFVYVPFFAFAFDLCFIVYLSFECLSRLRVLNFAKITILPIFYPSFLMMDDEQRSND